MHRHATESSDSNGLAVPNQLDGHRETHGYTLWEKPAYRSARLPLNRDTGPGPAAAPPGSFLDYQIRPSPTRSSAASLAISLSAESAMLL